MTHRYCAYFKIKTGRDIKKRSKAKTEGERGGSMADFAVLERGDGLARRLVSRLGPAVPADREPGLLVIASGAKILPEWSPLRCGTVLLPGEESGLLQHIQARSAVSYGLSGRDTITLSSRKKDCLWVAVQRELVRLDGTVLERQEVPVSVERGEEEMEALALAGALLLLGAEPEELCKKG